MGHRISWDSTTGKDTLKTLVKKTFQTSDREVLNDHPKICKTESVSDEFDRDLRLGGLGQASELTDGEAIPLSEMPEPETKDYTQGRWGQGFRITAGMKFFNKIGLMKRLTKELKRSMIETKDIDIFRMWNNSTATTYAAGWDTLALASNSHTIMSGSTTYDNYLDAALGVTSYESAKVYFKKLVDDTGMTFSAVPDTLLCSVEYDREATELIRSSLRYDTADNAINVYKNDVNILSTPRITSSTFWALLATKHSNYDIKVYTSMMPNLLVKDAPDNTKDTVVLSDQWYTYGFGNPSPCFIGDA